MLVTKAHKARCAQCGRELKHVIFANVKNIICKDCYGPDRYRQHSQSAPPTFEEDRPAEWVATRETETVEP